MIGISVSKTDVIRFESAINKVRKQVSKEQELLPKKTAVLYLNDLKNALVSQKYASQWPAHNDMYVWNKEKGGYHTDFWRRTDQLLHSLTVFPFKDEVGDTVYGAGIPPKTINIETGDDISKYALQMEYGSSRQPARPLFRPTLEDFKKTTWLKLVNESAGRIRKSWR